MVACASDHDHQLTYFWTMALTIQETLNAKKRGEEVSSALRVTHPIQRRRPWSSTSLL